MNPDTSAIPGEAKAYSSSEDRGSFIEYRPSGSTDDSGFFELLGCPN